MAIFRVERTRDYTVMSNYHLRDRTLTLKAKGLLSMMLSLSDEWNYSTRGLAAISKEGVDAIGSALKELEAVGYIVRNRLRDDKGRIYDTEYVIYEKPSNTPEPDNPDTRSPCTAKPCTKKPYMDESCTDNPAQLITNKSITERLNTYGENIHQSSPRDRQIPSLSRDSPFTHQHGKQNAIVGIDTMEAYRSLIMDNIEYSALAKQFGPERVDEVVELMLDTILSQRDFIHIARSDYPCEVVKNRLLKLDQFHIEYVFSCLDRNTTKVRNVRAYLLTALYNAPVTIDSYYRAEVNHGMYGGGER